ncbi:phenylalanine--tRNA ligase subunit beta [Desulfovibrio ferrophilus]|uniref:Phenylalanine--tRNA ligase beta subunit n=1 Tax=Desulfovibrio ferrophilus TaxID=241368 RepID=A0A2Z6B0Z3_9BACT|nr:phenylalanine--tRNA ligase subunit beta [Desulfovibrio ferrophilus]BBD09125.1 phenylalanine--tRNA ligase beta subunit [Desulfovibrio ferrophilus]
MLLSLNWLREFVPFEGTDQELGDKLTMLGLELEEIIHPFEHLANVVVGHVVECDRHPEAEKLSVTKVDVGEAELLPIVCGAPNVAQGQKVAVAKIGAVLPGDFKIKKAKLRGQLSMGMICAEDELGLGDSHSGIMVLDESLEVGIPLVDALNLDQVVFDIGVTPNRADCNSVLGLARETALAYGLPLTLPELKLNESGEDCSDMVKIVIDDPAQCPLFQGRVIKGIQVGPAPAWMRYRLIAVGQRPISNMVDVSNYVMFELGHPNHAYDLNLIKGATIRVGQASDGQTFTTLDDQERKLTAADLLIWDAERPVGLAGVMGGAETEVHEGTTDIFLELAVFNPPTVRKTARRLSLPSEASYRFERGVDQGLAKYCIDRTAALMAECGAGQLLPGMCVSEPRPWLNRTLRFRRERAEKLLGIELSEEFCRTTITGMGCKVNDTNAEDWSVEAPSHRLDLEREVDLFEEIARVYGMDRIPAVLPRVSKSLDSIGKEDTRYTFTMKLKHWARGVGLREAINYSFVGDDELDLLGLPKEGRVPVMNPLSEDQNMMRTVLAPGLLGNVRTNVGHGSRHLRLFEVAHVFWADEHSETTVNEPTRLALMVTGRRERERWPWPAEDFAEYEDLKGFVEHLLQHLGLPGANFKTVEGHTYLTPCVQVIVDGRSVGLLGCVNGDVADHYNARRDVWLGELDVDLLREMFEALTPGFEPLAVYPPIRRDITVIAPEGLSVAQIIGAIEGMKVDLLEDVTMVDLYEPEGEAVRNVTVRLTYRHAKKTLKDKEVDKRHSKVVEGLLKALPVRV